MRTHRNKIRLNGRLPSGGIPLHLMDGLPLARGDLQSRAERCRGAFCLDRGDARAGSTSFDTGPPGWRIRLPVSGANCRGSTPSKKILGHRGRCPDKVGTSAAICQSRFELGSDCFVPAGSELAMTIQRGWSPPGRNGPPEAQECYTRKRVTNRASPPYGCKRARESVRPLRAHPRWWDANDWESRVRFQGNGPSKHSPSHRERCPNKVGTSVAICRIRSESGSDCFAPKESALAMTIRIGWSPPGRNGPVGISPPTGQKRARESIRPTCARILRWNDEDEESSVGFRGSGPPKSDTRHPKADLSAEGSDQVRCYQILRPNGLGLRWTQSMGCETTMKSNWSADEKQCSVSELCEGRKFSRSEDFGTPSFSLIANQIEDLFTINTFS